MADQRQILQILLSGSLPRILDASSNCLFNNKDCRLFTLKSIRCIYKNHLNMGSRAQKWNSPPAIQILKSWACVSDLGVSIQVRRVTGTDGVRPSSTDDHTASGSAACTQRMAFNHSPHLQECKTLPSWTRKQSNDRQ